MLYIMQNCVYEFGKSIYINLTNECSNSCDFCIRNFKEGVGGSELWLDHEPSAAEVEAELEKRDLASYDGAVFCGFGEPTCAFDRLLEVAAWLKARGVSTRLNTNGQANLICGATDAAERLAPVMDSVSVSLNASSAEKYQATCHSRFGEKGYAAMLDFVRDCVRAGIDTTVSVVDLIGEKEVEECGKIAASLGAKYRVRPAIEADSDC